jgi:putative transposase
VSAVASALGVSRPHLSSSRQRAAPRRRGRPPLPDADLLAAIQTLIADLPTYGYRRVHALLRRRAEQEGRPAPNVKRVYRVMKLHGLLLQRHAGGAEARRHEGKVAVAARNTRWCSDGLEIGCENGERVQVAFALDCCDREAMSFVATTAGITGENVRDLAAVEHRFGRVNRLPVEIEWLTDNSLPRT